MNSSRPVRSLPSARRALLRRCAAWLREFFRFLRLGLAAAAVPAASHAAAAVGSAFAARAARVADGASLGQSALIDGLVDAMVRPAPAAGSGETGRRWYLAIPSTWSRLDALPGEDRAEFDTWAVTGGFGWPQSRAPRLTVGFGVFAQNGEVGDALRFDQLGAGLALIGERDFGPWALRAEVGSVALRLKTKRALAGTPGSWRGETDGVLQHGRVTIARVFRTDATALTLSGGVAGATTDYDGLVERGPATGARRLDDFGADTVRGFVAAHGEGRTWRLGRLGVRLEGLVRLEHELADRAVQVTTRATPPVAGAPVDAATGTASRGRRLHLVGEPRLVFWSDEGVTGSLALRTETDGDDFRRLGASIQVSRRF